MVRHVNVGSVRMFDAKHTDATRGTGRIGPPRLRVGVIAGAEPPAFADDMHTMAMFVRGAEQTSSRWRRIGWPVMRHSGRANRGGCASHTGLDHHRAAGRTAAPVDIEFALEYAHRLVTMVTAPMHHGSVHELRHHEPQGVVLWTDLFAPCHAGHILRDRICRRSRNLIEPDGRELRHRLPPWTRSTVPSNDRSRLRQASRAPV